MELAETALGANNDNQKAAAQTHRPRGDELLRCK
jgi:hypothetical protein